MGDRLNKGERRKLRRQNQRQRDLEREGALVGATPQERFRYDVNRTEQQRHQTPDAVPENLRVWVESSPGTNMLESPPLSQAEANQIAKILGIPTGGNMPHIGANMYSINCPVTPNMAYDWLYKYNIENRIPGKSNWKALEGDINTGRWIPTHQAFGFIVSRESGTISPILADGQHRARGIHEAGYPVRAVVTINVLPESVRVMDTHMIRTVRTLITLGGRNMRAVMENAVRVAISGPIANAPKPSMNAQFWFAQQGMEIIERVNEIAGRVLKNVTLGSVLAVVIRAAISAETDERKERIFKFLQILQDGPSGDQADLAALNIREWLQTKRPKGISSHQLYLRVAPQLVLFLDGKQSNQIREAGTDPFPLPEWVIKGLAGQATGEDPVAEADDEPEEGGRTAVGG